MSAFAVETDKRMLKAKERLEHVLDAGELLEMDRRLTTLFKQGQADAALLLCLNANVEAADPGTDKHSIMLHLYTRAQEEFEKKQIPRALVHKLCRQPDAQIRDNILRTYLAPQTELIAPDATRIPLETPMPAQISHAFFGRRGVDRRAAAGFRCGWRFSECEHRQCRRQVAIEARRVLLETGHPNTSAPSRMELAPRGRWGRRTHLHANTVWWQYSSRAPRVGPAVHERVGAASATVESDRASSGGPGRGRGRSGRGADQGFVVGMRS